MAAFAPTEPKKAAKVKNINAFMISPWIKSNVNHLAILMPRFKPFLVNRFENL
jgi:hypothetical protein